MKIPSKPKLLLIRLLVFLGSLFIMLTFSELFFYFYTDFSTSFGSETLINRRWVERYWNPINSMGYRDIEVESASNKKKLIVAGDSFIAGHGIKSIYDRASNQLLDDELSKTWTVNSVAECGWDLNDSLNGLLNYPINPDLLIQSIFYNDIDKIARKYSYEPKTPFEEKNYILNYAINNFYSASYAYWKFKLITMRSHYSNVLNDAYKNPKVLSDFSEQIDSIADYASSRNAKLLFIVWPNLKDVQDKSGNMSVILSLLKNYEHLDLTDIISKLPENELCASELDAHPSKLVNREIGIHLRKHLKDSIHFDFK
jgi:hypothetical protein